MTGSWSFAPENWVSMQIVTPAEASMIFIFFLFLLCLMRCSAEGSTNGRCVPVVCGSVITAFISSVQIVNPSKISEYGLHKYNGPDWTVIWTSASSTDQTCVDQGTTPTAAQAGRLWQEGTSALFVSITSIIVILEHFTPHRMLHHWKCFYTFWKCRREINIQSFAADKNEFKLLLGQYQIRNKMRCYCEYVNVFVCQMKSIGHIDTDCSFQVLKSI